MAGDEKTLRGIHTHTHTQGYVYTGSHRHATYTRNTHRDVHTDRHACTATELHGHKHKPIYIQFDTYERQYGRGDNS